MSLHSKVNAYSRGRLFDNPMFRVGVHSREVSRQSNTREGVSKNVFTTKKLWSIARGSFYHICFKKFQTFVVSVKSLLHLSLVFARPNVSLLKSWLIVTYS